MTPPNSVLVVRREEISGKPYYMLIMTLAELVGYMDLREPDERIRAQIAQRRALLSNPALASHPIRGILPNSTQVGRTEDPYKFTLSIPATDPILVTDGIDRIYAFKDEQPDMNVLVAFAAGQENLQPTKIDYRGDLFNVGTEKAVGYLSISTLTGCGSTIQDVQDWAKRKGFVCKVFGEADCRIFSGSVWVYDRKMLQNILTEQAAVLQAAGIPLTPDEYVLDIIHCTYSPSETEAYSTGVFSVKPCSPEAFRAIGLTFNDYRWRNEKAKDPA